MRSFFLLTLLFASVPSGCASPEEPSTRRCGADWAITVGPGVVGALAVDSEGNVVVHVAEPGGLSTLVRYGAEGREEHRRSFSARIPRHGLAVDDAGNAIVVGTAATAVDFVGGTLGPGPFVAAIDASGHLLWAHGFTADDVPTAVAVAPAGSVAVAGGFDVDGDGARALALLYLDASGRPAGYTRLTSWDASWDTEVPALAAASDGTFRVGKPRYGAWAVGPDGIVFEVAWPMVDHVGALATAGTRAAYGGVSVAGLPIVGSIDGTGFGTWAHVGTTNGSGTLRAIAMRDDGAVVAGGEMVGRDSRSPASLELAGASIRGLSGRDGWLAILASDGTVSRLEAWGSERADAISALAVSPCGAIVVGGSIGGVVETPGGILAPFEPAPITTSDSAFVVRFAPE